MTTTAGAAGEDVLHVSATKYEAERQNIIYYFKRFPN
jgi:hypothetical protein